MLGHLGTCSFRQTVSGRAAARSFPVTGSSPQAAAPSGKFSSVDEELVVLPNIQFKNRSNKYTVTAGDGDLSYTSVTERTQIINRRATVHEHYSDSPLINDIALIKLNKPWAFGKLSIQIGSLTSTLTVF